MKRFLDLYFTGWKKFADFKGRACRAEICAFELTNLLINIILVSLDVIFLGIMEKTSGSPSWILVIIIVALFFLFNILSLIPTFAIRARRLHDFGLPGIIQIILVFAYLLAAICKIAGINHSVFSLTYIIGIILLCTVIGTNGENKYGAPSEKY